MANGERREWIKPIMFSGGLGSIEDKHVMKEEAEPGKNRQFMDHHIRKLITYNSIVLDHLIVQS